MLSQLLYFDRALYQMYQHMHWQNAGKTYYGDHLLFERLYSDVQGELDKLAEKAIGISNDSRAIDPVKGSEEVSKILDVIYEKNITPDDFPKVAIKAEKTFLEMIKKYMSENPSDGVQNMIQEIADKHEEHLYLLQQRTRESSMLFELFKLANTLDTRGEFDIANDVDEVIKEILATSAVSLSDIVSMADYFDAEGNTKMADKLDVMAKSKYKTWKGKSEKPLKGAEHRAPKAWFDKMKKEIKQKNPDYSAKRVNEIVGDIWDNELSDAKRKKIYKQHGKTKDPNK